MKYKLKQCRIWARSKKDGEVTNICDPNSNEDDFLEFFEYNGISSSDGSGNYEDFDIFIETPDVDKEGLQKAFFNLDNLSSQSRPEHLQILKLKLKEYSQVKLKLTEYYENETLFPSEGEVSKPSLDKKDSLQVIEASLRVLKSELYLLATFLEVVNRQIILDEGAFVIKVQPNISFNYKLDRFDEALSIDIHCPTTNIVRLD